MILEWQEGHHYIDLQGLIFERQKSLPLIYKGHAIGEELKIDLLIANTVIVELKSVAELLPVHEAQLLTYMKLANCPAGLLMNFNVPLLKQGIKRMLNT